MERYVLHVTKQCVCNCSYCYEQDKTSIYTWKDLRLIIDNILEYNKEFEVEFLGGEPLLAFNLIKKSVDYLNKKAKVPLFIITTNGTILNKEILDFLQQNQNIVMAISLDGTKSMNKERTFKKGDNTYDSVIKNAKQLFNIIGINRVWVHMVVHPKNVDLISEGVEHLYNIGFRLIDIGIYEGELLQEGTEYYNHFEDIFIEQHKKIAIDIIKGKYKNIVFPIFNTNIEKSHRIYMKDETGKVVSESYGRVENDVTSTNLYEIIDCSNEVETYPQKLKRIVSENYLKLKRRYK